eukprot:scaffold810_cov117-Cylindrotheca_fusiformis.AAC.1
MVQVSLDPSFFERVKSNYKQKENVMAEFFKSAFPQSTLVLFSKRTATPLAALTLTTDHPECLSMFTARPPPAMATEDYFQGLINRAKVAFDFTISNLSENGKINFNILHTPRRVSTTDSG